MRWCLTSSRRQTSLWVSTGGAAAPEGWQHPPRSAGCDRSQPQGKPHGKYRLPRASAGKRGRRTWRARRVGRRSNTRLSRSEMAFVARRRSTTLAYLDERHSEAPGRRGDKPTLDAKSCYQALHAADTLIVLTGEHRKKVRAAISECPDKTVDAVYAAELFEGMIETLRRLAQVQREELDIEVNHDRRIREPLAKSKVPEKLAALAHTLQNHHRTMGIHARYVMLCAGADRHGVSLGQATEEAVLRLAHCTRSCAVADEMAARTEQDHMFHADLAKRSAVGHQIHVPYLK